ncbi:hypothetical protein [Streptomyces sp. NPDC086023]|uniref:hypothetical protein n=1 Tax=Streptomyces sp. NPDC086023 TaxID=3365746 RepID=UPI0037D29C73
MTDDASEPRPFRADGPPAPRGRPVLTGTRTPAGYPEGRIPAVPGARAIAGGSVLPVARSVRRTSLRATPSVADTLPFVAGAGERRPAP